MKAGDKVLIPATRPRYGAPREMRESEVLKVTPKGSLRLEGFSSLFKYQKYGSYWTNAGDIRVFEYSDKKLAELKDQEIDIFSKYEKEKQVERERQREIAKRQDARKELAKTKFATEIQTLLESAKELPNGETLYQTDMSLSTICYLICKTCPVKPEFYMLDNGKFEANCTYISGRRTGSFSSVSSIYGETVEDCLQQILSRHVEEN